MEPSFTSGQVATALHIPPRRIEGWAEKGLLSPRVLRGRTRFGDRRQYTWPDVMMAAILVEAQRILGTQLRPGILAEAIAAVGAKSYGLLGAIPAAGAVLVLHIVKGEPKAEVLYKPVLGHLPTAALIVNLARLGPQVQEALKHVKRA